MAGSKGMTYFLHQKCGSNVYLDVSSIFRIVTGFGIGKNVLRVRNGSIIQVGEASKTVFFCSSCNQTISNIDEIIGVCMHCGKTSPIKDMVSPSVSNGIYCKTHGTMERFPGEIIRDLKNIVQKMSIKG